MARPLNCLVSVPPSLPPHFLYTQDKGLLSAFRSQ